VFNRVCKSGTQLFSLLQMQMIINTYFSPSQIFFVFLFFSPLPRLFRLRPVSGWHTNGPHNLIFTSAVAQ